MEEMMKITDKDQEMAFKAIDDLSTLNTICNQWKWIPVHLADPRNCGYSHEPLLLRILMDDGKDGLLFVTVGRVGERDDDRVDTDSWFVMMSGKDGVDGSLPFSEVTHWMPIPDYFQVEE